jgi:hypothetical protein
MGGEELIKSPNAGIIITRLQDSSTPADAIIYDPKTMHFNSFPQLPLSKVYENEGYDEGEEWEDETEGTVVEAEETVDSTVAY